MVKMNIEDLSPQTAFPSSIGKDKELSLIVYSSLIKNFEKQEDSTFIIELLMSINELSITAIKTIFKYEIDLLKDLNNKHSDLICLTKINNFFANTSLEAITVFSSLSQGIPETKSNVYFKEEIFKLSEILEEIINVHTENYKDIDKEDENFNKINENIYFLSNLLNMVKNYAFKNIKRLASDISSKMNIEDQVHVIARLINISKGDTLSELNTKQLKYHKQNEDGIEEAILVEEEKQQKDIASNNNMNSNINSLVVFEKIQKDISADISLIKESLTQQLNFLKKENAELKENLKELTKLNTSFMNNFSAFMENQLVMQKVIQEKYNIKF